MAEAGYGSRRENEKFIDEGRVLVNGKRAILGTKANPSIDQIVIDGKKIKQIQSKVYIALYKPRGVLSDYDQKDNRTTVKNLVPDYGHLFSVGRLDYDSEGLILLTNDGELANRLTHPRYGHEKEYRVLLSSKPDETQLATWRRGVVLEDGYKTAPAKVFIQSSAGKGVWLKVIMKEGKKRQIRETAKQIGLYVEKLIRIRIGTLEIKAMKAGEWRHLTNIEIDNLKQITEKNTIR
jgi:23S rRNA pseudouridine2605 synthase